MIHTNCAFTVTMPHRNGLWPSLCASGVCTVYVLKVSLKPARLFLAAEASVFSS